MTEFWSLYLPALGLLLVATTLVWTVSVWLKNASIVDPVWGLLYLLAGWFYYARTTEMGMGDSTRQLLVMVLVTLWGLRLSLFLFWRNAGKGEDYRYQNFRQHYGPERYWWFSLFQVFWLQGALAWLVSAPLLGAQYQGRRLNWLDGVALLVWLVGFVFEAGGDWQLAQFKANPANKGKLLTTGFWRYTRHPNYFGDAAVWWGFALFALAAGSYFTIIGTAIMTYLLLKVSGVAMLERTLVKTKPGYEAYMRQTSAFLPRPPKK